MPWGVDAVFDELHMLSDSQVGAQAHTLGASSIPTSANPSALAKWILAISEGKFPLPNDVGMLSAVFLEPGAPKKKNPVEKALAVNAR